MTLREADLHTMPLESLPCPVTSSLLQPASQRTEQNVQAAGKLAILASSTDALFCSAQCPGAAILRTFERMTAMRDAGQIVLGGFHSPMEQDCLRILLRGKQPVVLVLARTLLNMQLAPELVLAYREGRLLLLSPFGPQHKRVTSALAAKRNRFAAAIATNVLIAYAAPGSRTATLADEVRAAGKPVEMLYRPETEERSPWK